MCIRDSSSWDLNKPYEAYEAMRKVEEKRALLINMSPNHAMGKEWHMEKNEEEKWVNMKRHVEWCAELARIQHNQNMYFMYSHPAEAQSWRMPCIMRMAKAEGVQTLCGMGFRWMTNSVEVADLLVKMMEGGEEWHLRNPGDEYGENMSE